MRLKQKKWKMRPVLLVLLLLLVLVFLLCSPTHLEERNLRSFESREEAFQAKILGVIDYLFIDFPFKRLTRTNELQKKNWLDLRPAAGGKFFFRGATPGKRVSLKKFILPLSQRFFLSGACRGRQKLIFPQQAILNPQKKPKKILRLRRSWKINLFHL